jgi:hypothetical protein
MKAKRRWTRLRVVVGEHLSDPARAARVLEALATLQFTGVLDQVRAHVRVAMGALVQQARVLPALTKRVAAFGERVLGALESAVVGASMWLAMREARAANVASTEAAQLRAVQVLMDLVHEGDSAFDHEARIAVAGLGGLGAWWSGTSWVTSGFEEAVNLADDVRLAVLGVVDNPFARFLPKSDGAVRSWEASAGVKRRERLAGGAELLSTLRPDGATWTSVIPADTAQRVVRRKQVGRDKPAHPGLTDPRDASILRAMKAGHRGKEVWGATGQFGLPSSESHVGKRRRDFLRWGWVTRGRDSTLTEDGLRWLAEIPHERGGVPFGDARSVTRAARSASDDVRRSGPKDAR